MTTETDMMTTDLEHGAGDDPANDGAATMHSDPAAATAKTAGAETAGAAGAETAGAAAADTAGAAGAETTGAGAADTAGAAAVDTAGAAGAETAGTTGAAGAAATAGAGSVMARRVDATHKAALRQHGASPIFDLHNVDVYYGAYRAVRDVSMEVYPNEITAIIGPSGCGKSTMLRCLNRMNDLVAGARVEGTINYHGVDLYNPKVDAVEVRRRIGMVFQKPNPFPKSIYDNVAYGPRVAGTRKKAVLNDIVEESLRRSALWDEVKDRLKDSAIGMSGGQQQRLCIARAIAAKPDVLLMDEPCSALDPIATVRIEELMRELKSDYTIVIVTHNMQQAARVSDRTAFFTAEVDPATENRVGILVEYDETGTIFGNPSDERTENYITGRFG